ncbi:MAG: transposase [bacterium]
MILYLTGLASRPTMMNEPKTYYRRHLPHYQPEHGIFHVVFRLTGSLPVEVIEELRQEREQWERKAKEVKDAGEQQKQLTQVRWAYFERFDTLLDGTSSGPMWLKQTEAAIVVTEAICHRDGKEYDLLAYCIMPNHVHLVFELVGRLAESTSTKDGRDGVSTYIVTQILESLKKYTALRVNRVLHRSGAFWQHESYDHVIRDEEELEKTIWYVLLNPVKAGLVKEWEQWKWTYCKPGLL